MMSFTAQLVIFNIASFISGVTLNEADETDGDIMWISLAIVSVAASIASVVPLLNSCNIRFGSPDIPCSFACIGAFLCTLTISASELQNPAVVGETLAPIFALLVMPLVVIVGCNFRGLMLLPLGLGTLLSVYPIRPVYNSSTNLLVGVGMLCSMFVPYVWDQRMIFLLVVSGCMAIMSGAFVHKDGGFMYIGVSLALCYTTALFNRWRRRLPPALEGCLFIRMGFLRNLKATGGRIRRCQELPPEAFGDVGKASILLTTSHRWLDRYFCDIVDEMNPNGVRLTSMLRRLAFTYPESLSGVSGNGFCSFVSRLVNGLTTGGSDVVLFFDFMGLPQIGKLPDGSLIERTEAESRLFSVALPAMGAMYSMYQVLVIPEVSGNVHPYFASGWCFSEFCSAMLTQKLKQFSAEALVEYAEWLSTTADSGETRVSVETLEKQSSEALTAQGVADFTTMFETELSKKRLFNEDDRVIIRGIVSGYLLLRLLGDAIRNQNEPEVQRLLAELAHKELESNLYAPIDQSLDTLLHVAARLPSKDIILALLRAGCDPNVRNLYGDTPTQFYMLPRLGEGARLCQSWQNGPPENYQSVGP